MKKSFTVHRSPLAVRYLFTFIYGQCVVNGKWQTVNGAGGAA